MAIENKNMKKENANKGLVISFSDDDYPKGFDCDHDDSMVIIATVHNYSIERILVDQTSS